MKWTDITLRQHIDLVDIQTNPDLSQEQKIGLIVQTVYGKNINLIPLNELTPMLEGLDFLQIPAEPDKKRFKSIKLGEHTYEVTYDMSKFTAGQYLDFTTYSKNATDNIVKMISCFIWPKGHKYGDGYDVEEVESDILNYMTVQDVTTLTFFLLKEQVKYTKSLANYSMWTILKTKMPWKVKKEILKVQAMASYSMEHLLT